MLPCLTVGALPGRAGGVCRAGGRDCSRTASGDASRSAEPRREKRWAAWCTCLIARLSTTHFQLPRTAHACVPYEWTRDRYGRARKTRHASPSKQPPHLRWHESSQVQSAGVSFEVRRNEDRPRRGIVSACGNRGIRAAAEAVRDFGNRSVSEISRGAGSVRVFRGFEGEQRARPGDSCDDQAPTPSCAAIAA